MAWKLTAMYMNFFRFPVLVFDIRAATIATALAITTSSAVLGAFIAVRRAIALPPAEAMRPESPPIFRRGLIERIHLQNAFSFGTRMVLRNLERRPFKAFLSVLGIAFAVSIIVTGRYFYDAVERIVQVQFGEVQRESVSVDFNEPRPGHVRYELAHLPRALRVEPFRAVAARIRYGHREKRIAIIGRSPADQLRRIVDRDDRRFGLPLNGLVITSELAKILGVHAGDAVTIEVLEGKRPVRQVIVSGLADELIGLSAYMNIDALNRIMGEQDALSGAYLLVDPREIDALQSTLKKNPTVTGVGAPAEGLASFRKTFAESMGITTAWIIAFACAIAIGMVYNGSRTSLSERARELASLRILGFTRAEITRLLLGEQALLTTVALPIGFAIGVAIAYLWARSMGTEIFRLPMNISRQTIAFTTFVIGAAAVFSGFLVRRRLHRLDLVAVLKSRE
jgi:putative ABC transport system permease protein